MSGGVVRQAEQAATALAVSPDGKWLAWGDGDGRIGLWPLPKGDPIVLPQVGTTIVQCTATDAAGNTTQSSFSITVNVATVRVDIKPGDTTNSINPRSQGSVAVAIFGSARFDVTAVDVATVRVAGASAELRKNCTPKYSFEDVDGDGFLDLVLHVRTEDLQIRDGDAVAVIEGKTFGGDFFTGIDAIRTVPNRK